MSTYNELDTRIISAIAGRNNPLYHRHVHEEAGRIARATGREDFRVIDGRLQALRKKGKIRYISKDHANGAGGWHVVGDSQC